MLRRGVPTCALVDGPTLYWAAQTVGTDDHLTGELFRKTTIRCRDLKGAVEFSTLHFQRWIGALSRGSATAEAHAERLYFAAMAAMAEHLARSRR